MAKVVKQKRRAAARPAPAKRAEMEADLEEIRKAREWYNWAGIEYGVYVEFGVTQVGAVPLIRLHFGKEDAEDIITALRAALWPFNPRMQRYEAPGAKARG